MEMQDELKKQREKVSIAEIPGGFYSEKQWPEQRKLPAGGQKGYQNITTSLYSKRKES